MRRNGFTLTQLRYFLAACETLSTSRAAERLCVAQSGVSTAITHLEGLTGSTLFVRIPTKGLRLTAEGRELRRIAGDMVARAEEISRFGRATQSRMVGQVRVACFRTLVPHILPRLHQALRERYPDLRVDMIETSYAETLERIRSADVLFGLLYDAGIPADLTVEHIATSRPYLLVGADHRFADRDAVALSELDGEQMVTLDLHTSREYAHRLVRASGAAVREAEATSSVEALRAMVAVGGYFAILNQHPGHEHTVLGAPLRTVPIAGAVEVPRVALVARNDYQFSTRAQAVQQTLRDVGETLTAHQMLPPDPD